MSRASRRKKLLEKRGATMAPPIFDAELVPDEELPTPQARPAASVSRRVMMEFQSYAGPIPPPEILGQYEQVCPGAADRILTQFEEQGRHRRVLVFLAAIGIGAFLLYNDKSVEGIASIVTAVGGAAWVLRKAEAAKKQDLARKREDGGRK